MNTWRDSFPVLQARVRPLACFAAMALIGAILGQGAVMPLGGWLALCLAVLTAIAVRAARRRRVLALVMLLGLCLGGLRMTVALDLFPAVETLYNVRMSGRVVSDPFVKPDTGRLIVKYRLDSMDETPSNLTLRLYLRGEPEELSAIEYGQILHLTGHIWENDATTNPFEFDFGAYLHRNGADAMATAKIEDTVIVAQRRDMQSVIVDIRHAIARRIDALFPENAALVRALVLGDRSLIDEEMRERLSATGTAHLISISGLHVTLLALALSEALSLIISRRRASLIVLGPLLFYGALIGFTAPFVRALIMFALFSFGASEGLPSDPVTRLAAALLGFLAVNPLAIGDSGFILSFSASAGIILLMAPIQSLLGLKDFLTRKPEADPWRRTMHTFVSYFPALLCASLSAQLATLPAVIASFGVQSVISIPFNLICVPLCMVGYILAMIALTISALIHPLGMLLAFPADRLFTLMLSAMRISAALPLTGVRIGRYPVILVLLHAVLVLAASGLSAIPERIRRFLPLSLLAVAGLSSLVVWLWAWPFGVTFLDADQADCAVVRTQGHTYVFDVGDTYTPLADYLNGTAVGVDAVFLSHPHQDHAGGLTDLLQSFRPGTIYVPKGWFDTQDTSSAVTDGIERAREMGVQIVELAAGDAMDLSHAARLTVYNPPPDTIPAEVNDLSLLLNVTCDGHSVAFTGDLTMNGEPEVIPDCDILKVAHHGADNATSARFLDAATPDIAVISVGENNFGHPDEMTLQRLRESGAQILRTDMLGAITLTPDGEGWRIKTYLEAPNELE